MPDISLPRSGACVSVQMIAQGWSDMPASELQRILGFRDDAEAVTFAKAYGVPVIDGERENSFISLSASRPFYFVRNVMHARLARYAWFVWSRTQDLDQQLSFSEHMPRRWYPLMPGSARTRSIPRLLAFALPPSPACVPRVCPWKRDACVHVPVSPPPGAVKEEGGRQMDQHVPSAE